MYITVIVEPELDDQGLRLRFDLDKLVRIIKRHKKPPDRILLDIRGDDGVLPCIIQICGARVEIV